MRAGTTLSRQMSIWFLMLQAISMKGKPVCWDRSWIGVVCVRGDVGVCVCVSEKGWWDISLIDRVGSGAVGEGGSGGGGPAGRTRWSITGGIRNVTARSERGEAWKMGMVGEGREHQSAGLFLCHMRGAGGATSHSSNGQWRS